LRDPVRIEPIVGKGRKTAVGRAQQALGAEQLNRALGLDSTLSTWD
jgi:hypothetical protein